MHTTLLTAHILLLSASIVLTAASAGMALFRQRVRTSWTLVNLAVTTIGLLLGAVLLASSPIDAKCLMLLGYLAAFTATELFVKRRNQVFATSPES